MNGKVVMDDKVFTGGPGSIPVMLNRQHSDDWDWESSKKRCFQDVEKLNHWFFSRQPERVWLVRRTLPDSKADPSWLDQAGPRREVHPGQEVLQRHRCSGEGHHDRGVRVRQTCRTVRRQHLLRLVVSWPRYHLFA